jgi:septal ring factor EnvC (AmiA/AmiB activator)
LAGTEEVNAELKTQLRAVTKDNADLSTRVRNANGTRQSLKNNVKCLEQRIATSPPTPTTKC